MYLETIEKKLNVMADLKKDNDYQNYNVPRYYRKNIKNNDKS